MKKLFLSVLFALPLFLTLSCDKTISTHDEDGAENKLQAVDLGLSVKWANMNLGASSSDELGDRYAWGETSSRYQFNEKDYAFYGNAVHRVKVDNDYFRTDAKACYSKYYTKEQITDALLTIWIKEAAEKGKTAEFVPEVVDLTELEKCDDAAYENMGKGWRIPSESEWEELVTKCTTSLVMGGYKFTGPNKNSIVLSFQDYYWTRTLDDELEAYAVSVQLVQLLDIFKSKERFKGCQIRAVYDSDKYN